MLSVGKEEACEDNLLAGEGDVWFMRCYLRWGNLWVACAVRRMEGLLSGCLRFFACKGRCSISHEILLVVGEFVGWLWWYL